MIKMKGMFMFLLIVGSTNTVKKHTPNIASNAAEIKPNINLQYIEFNKLFKNFSINSSFLDHILTNKNHRV